VPVTAIVQRPLVVVAALVKVSEFVTEKPAPVLPLKSCGLGAPSVAVMPVAVPVGPVTETT
jgi:hypothetical protein